MLRRAAHQCGDAPGRTGARATATSKLATGQWTECGNQTEREETELLFRNNLMNEPHWHGRNLRVRHHATAGERFGTQDKEATVGNAFSGRKRT